MLWSSNLLGHGGTLQLKNCGDGEKETPAVLGKGPLASGKLQAGLSLFQRVQDEPNILLIERLTQWSPWL